MHVEKDHSSEVELGCDLPSLVHRLIGVAVRDLGRQDIADFVVLKNGYGSIGQSRALTAGGYEGIDLDLVLQVIPSCNTGVVQRFLRNSWRRQAFFLESGCSLFEIGWALRRFNLPLVTIGHHTGWNGTRTRKHRPTDVPVGAGRGEAQGGHSSRSRVRDFPIEESFSNRNLSLTIHPRYSQALFRFAPRRNHRARVPGFVRPIRRDTFRRPREAIELKRLADRLYKAQDTALP